MPVIRRGEAGDLEEVSAIQEESPGAAAWRVAEYLEYEFRVAEEANRVVGYIVWRSLSEEEREVLNVAVAPGFRRRGVARDLLQNVLREATGDVFLEVRESNLAAREFYKYMGFQEIGTRKNYYNSPLEAAIVMKFHSC